MDITGAYPSPSNRPGSRFLTPQNAIRIGRQLGNYVRNRYKSASKKDKTRKRNSSSPQIYGGGATKPYTRQYSKRRRSRRVRRRAKKYYNSFRKAFRKISGVALQKTIFNGSVTATAVPAAQQWLATHLYPYNGGGTSNQETGRKDLDEILNTLVNPIMSDDTDNSGKRMFENAVIDITLNNISVTKLEIDMYHITYTNEKYYDSLKDLFNSANSAQNSLTGVPADRITINDRGATLFDLNQFLSIGGIKILSKEKMFMGSGDVYNFQYKVKKLKSITPNEINQEDSHLAEPGLTHSWIFVFKGVTGITSEAALQVASTRTYTYRIDGLNIQATAKLPE